MLSGSEELDAASKTLLEKGPDLCVVTLGLLLLKGLPAVIVKLIAKKWVLVPTRWNLYFTEKILLPYYMEPPADQGAYIFFIAQKPKNKGLPD